MFRPLNKNVLLTIVKEEPNEDSLFLGTNSKKYEVVSIGKEVLELKVGDIVYLDEQKVKSLTIQNKDYYVIDEKDIYMIVGE